VQQELIVEIHRTSLWPTVVNVEGNISKPNETKFVDVEGSYIILIPDGNFNSIKAEMLGIHLKRKNKFNKIWNTEFRYVVASANEFSMSTQTDIFDYFSKFRIYNCIIVSKVHDKIDKVYSRQINVNAVDTDMKLGVYTWFPYQSSDRCTEVNNITLLDSWVISAQGHFTKNTDLFPIKISNTFNGCPMEAVVRDGRWEFTTYYVNVTDSSGSVVTNVIGFEFDLLKLVLKQINMTFIHVPTPDGFEIEKGSTDNLIRSMLVKESYIALGVVGTHYLINPFFDSTNSYNMMRIRWYVPCSDKYPRWSSIFRILSLELWLVLIISIVIAAILTTLVGRYSCTSEWKVYKTLTSSFTNLWAVILGVSVSTMPRTPSLRALFLAWVCFSVAFSTVFQAFLTTFLIDSGYKTPIKNKDELYESGIKLYHLPDFNFVFENVDETEVSNVQRNRANCPSYKVCLDWARNYKNVSILFDDTDAEIYYAESRMVGENSEPLVCKLADGVIFNSGRSMLMLQGDPLMRRVAEIIDRVVEAGLYTFWISLKMHKIKVQSPRKISLVHSLDGYYSFNLYHMQPAFYLLLIGWFLSAFCFMIELFYNYFLRKRY
jgi:hypothetical protein